MKNITMAPKTREEAEAPTAARTVTITLGVLGIFAIASWNPLLWAVTGAIIVPIVWVRSGRKKRAMMQLSGCATNEDWKAFVASLPKAKDLKSNDGQVESTATLLASPKRPISKPSAPRVPSELQLPIYNLLATSSFANIEVVGEAFREKDVLAAMGGLRADEEKELNDVPAHLIPEPSNPHDKHAVMVWIHGYHVGYLSREDARSYAPILSQIVRAGYLPTANGRLWGAARPYWDNPRKLNYHLYARVALAEPALIIPTNNPPATPYSFLPWGPGIQVTKEDQHLAQLFEHLHGPESFAIATLVQSTKTLRNGATRDFVTVCLDGDEIGELTPATSDKLLPAIRHLRDLELQTAVWAKVKGSALAVEVVLQATKSHEIPAEWFEQVPVTVPALFDASQPTFEGLSSDQENREKNWDWND